jgi:peptide chain release factor 3
MDRPSLEPLELIDQIEREFGLTCHPVVWPIGSGPEFQGVLDREQRTVQIMNTRQKREEGKWV